MKKYLLKYENSISIMLLIEGTVLDEIYKLDNIPLDYREITDEDLPTNREFRNAWCDVTEDKKVDIDLIKAKEIKLEELRIKRNKELCRLDIEYMKALSTDDNIKLQEVKDKQKIQRDLTEPLKNLNVSGYNDEEQLNKIRELGDK